MENNRKAFKTILKKITFRNRFNSDLSYNITLLVTFFIGLSLIFCTYAWFYASLNVKIDFFNVEVSNESGLFISFDGIDFASNIVITKDSIIDKLKETYPNHTNQWPSTGLYAVSSTGIHNPNSDKFKMFINTRLGYTGDNPRRLINTRYSDEGWPSTTNIYVAFDVFLKNVSGSPMSDNLFFKEGTAVTFQHEEEYDDSDGIINSMRIGIVKIGSTSLKADVKTIQNLTCNLNCEMAIYEPNSRKHSLASIRRVKKHNINLVDGVYSPTYAVIKAGYDLEPTNGQEGSMVPLDSEHFALQKTITNFDDSIFQVPNGITKARIYVWIEGQDIDSLESVNNGANLAVTINLFKDLAGYHYYDD